MNMEKTYLLKGNGIPFQIGLKNFDIIYFRWYTFIWEWTYWTPGCGQKGPMNLGLSIVPSGSFLRTGTLVFPETQHGLRGSCGVVCDRAGFLGKKL